MLEAREIESIVSRYLLHHICYIMTDKPSMVTDVTVINRITLNTAERGNLLNKTRGPTQTRVDTQVIGTEKNCLNKNMTELIQQSC